MYGCSDTVCDVRYRRFPRIRVTVYGIDYSYFDLFFCKIWPIQLAHGRTPLAWPTDGWLFPGQNGKCISPFAAYRRVKRVAKHVLPTRGVTALLRSSLDIGLWLCLVGILYIYIYIFYFLFIFYYARTLLCI